METSKIIENVFYYDTSLNSFRHGTVEISRGKITGVEETENSGDCSRFLIPGFINTHAHIAMSRFRGKLDDMNLEKFLEKTFKLDSARTPDDILHSSICGLYELLSNGITSFFDMYYDEDIIWEACNRMGIRAFLSWNTLDKEITTQKGDPVDNAENFIKDYGGKNSIIEPSIGIQGVYVASLDTMKGADQVSRKFDTLLHMHVSETRKEVYEFMDKTGKRPVEYLLENNLLSHRLNAAHCVWLNDHEIRALGKNEVNVSWNSESNLKLGTGGYPPVPELMNSGVNITIGTDSNGSNNSLNILESAKTGAISIKNSRWDAGMISAIDVFRMLTVNGGRASRIPNLGEIKVGAPADFNIIDGNHFSLQSSDPEIMVNQIIYSMNPGAITDTVINGEYIKKDGKMAAEIENNYRNSLCFLKTTFRV